MKCFYLFLICLFFAVFESYGQKMIIDEGETNYVIVLPQNADSIELKAASALQLYIYSCTDVSIPVLMENDYKASSKAFFLGKTRWTDAEIIRDEDLRDDGFLILQDRDNIYIYSNYSKGVYYGVSYFLEHYLGVRMYTPTDVLIPQCTSLQLPIVDIVSNPSFEFRDVLYYYPNHSQDYADFHCLHNNADLHRDWGMFVHTFRHLIPVEKYFQAHPEWFSYIDGKRVRDGQLCLSDSAMFEELCRNLSVMVTANPSAKVWSVSNNDNYNVCTCDKCRHLDSLYGGPSGTLIHFINQVADRFPDKVISTLGYQYTRMAPTSDIRPRDNVNIMFCSIECGREHALDTAASELSFRNDMINWAAKTDNIFMWDYVGQFRNMLDPFPNLQILQPNLKFFHDHGARMMFEQGTGADNITSWIELRCYLIAKLMWNVDADVDSIFTDFCTGYYGPAAQPIMDYYREMHRSLNASGKRLDIYGYPIDGVEGYLSPGQIKKYQSLIADAYHLAANDSAFTARIRFLELSLDYAVLELAMANVSDDLTFFKGKQRRLNTEMVFRSRRFVEDCKRFGVDCLVEMGRTPEQYKADIDNFLDKNRKGNMAYHAKIKLAHKPDKRYPAGGAKGLVDGVCGLLNYQHGWLGFYGEPLDATIDLGKKQVVNDVSADFFFFPLSWIFVPSKVEVYTSANGKRWTLAGTIEGTNPEELSRPDIHHFKLTDLNTHARYIRLVAHPLSQIPEWHRAVGNPCWIFCDEIIVR